MTDLPSGFTERQKKSTPDTPDFPCVSWDPAGGGLGMLKHARELIGDPDYVRVFWDGTQIAIVPTSPEHKNAYSANDGSISASWLTSRLDCRLEKGRYRAHDGDGMLVVDFAEGPINE